MRTYANRPIHTHPTGYHEGQHGPFKPGRVIGFGRARRELTHRVTGEWQGGRFTATIADTDHSLKAALLADPAHGRGLISRAYVVSLDGGRLGVDPRQWYAGPLISWDVDLTGSLACEFGDQIADVLGGVLGPDRVLPKRRITLTDFPDAPQASVALPVPILYSGQRTVAGTGGIPVVYVGTRVMADTNTWHEWVVAGHALKEFTYLNVDHAPVSGWGTDWAMPGQAGWSTVTGSTDPYRDYNGRRYACVYGKGAQADSVAAQEAQLLLECYGIERQGNGGGSLIANVSSQIVHWLVNWVLGDYQAGSWLPMPTYATGWAQVNAQSFYAVDAISSARLSGSPPGSPSGGSPGSPPAVVPVYEVSLYVGVRQDNTPTAPVTDDSVSVRDLLGWIARSCDIRIGLNEFHQWTATMLPDSVVGDDLDSYGTTIPARILKDSWRAQHAFDGQWTRLTALANRTHVVESANPSGEWGGTETYINTTLETSLGAQVAGPTLQLPFTPNYDAVTLGAQGEDIAQRVLARHAVPVRIITWETTRCGGSKSDLGDLVWVTHYGWPTARLVQVEMMETGLGSVTMSGWDVTHAVTVTEGSP